MSFVIVPQQDEIRSIVREELLAMEQRIMKKMESPLMSIQEAAKYYGVTTRTISNWIARGELNATSKGGKTYIKKEES